MWYAGLMPTPGVPVLTRPNTPPGSVQGGGAAAVLTATASCSAYRALDETTTEPLDLRVLSGRVGWLAALAGQIAQQVLEGSWEDQAVFEFNQPTGPDGRPLPSKAYMAARRLGLNVRVAGVYVPDRVYRMAQEHAGRLLRSAGYRQQLLEAVLATWPDNPLRRTHSTGRGTTSRSDRLGLAGISFVFLSVGRCQPAS